MNRALAGTAMLLAGAAMAAAAAGPGSYKERKQAQADAATQKAAAMAASQKGGYRVVNTIQIGGEWLWHRVLLDSDGKLFYAPRGRRTTVIDATNGKSVGEILTGDGADGVAIAPDAGRGFITMRDGTLTVFDTKTYRALGTLPIGIDPGPIIYDSVSKRILVDCQGTVVPVAPTMDLATGRPEPAIEIAGKVSDMVTDGQGMLYMTLKDKDEVAVVDTRVMKQVTVWSLGAFGRPVGISMDRLRSRLFMACRNNMVVMSASDGHIIDNVNIGQAATGTAFAEGKVFVCGEQGVVSIIGQNAEGKFQVEQSVLVDGSLHAPKANPKTGEIYVPAVEMKNRRPVDGTFKIFVLGKK